MELIAVIAILVAPVAVISTVFISVLTPTPSIIRIGTSKGGHGQ